MKLTFLGAAGTVTGSKYLVEGGGKRVLVDCGLFQGLKELRLRNWDPPPVDPRSLDAVVLTHAHLDHSGYLPRLVKSGFAGPVWSTAAARELAGILLPDSAHLQEEDARYANKRGYSKHHPALPLYTQDDAEAALALFHAVKFDTTFEIGGLRIHLTPAGHMLGAACVHIDGDGTGVVFTGDVGRPNNPLMRPPSPLKNVRNLVVESTYGNRRHEATDPSAQLGEVLARVLAREGIVMIPAFAVGRSQEILLLISRLKAAGTREQSIDQGAEELKIHGEYVPIRVERIRIDGMSGHADYVELGDWLASIESPPRQVFITHGDPPAADTFRRYLHDRLGWEPAIPRHGDTVELG